MSGIWTTIVAATRIAALVSVGASNIALSAYARMAVSILSLSLFCQIAFRSSIVLLALYLITRVLRKNGSQVRRIPIEDTFKGLVAVHFAFSVSSYSIETVDLNAGLRFLLIDGVAFANLVAMVMVLSLWYVHAATKWSDKRTNRLLETVELPHSIISAHAAPVCPERSLIRGKDLTFYSDARSDFVR